MGHLLNLFLNMPIKLKLIASHTLLLLLTAVFMFIYYPAQQKKQLERELNNKLRDMTEMVALGVEVALYTGDSAIIAEVSNWAKSDQDLACILVLDENQEEIVSYNADILPGSLASLLKATSITTLGNLSYFTAPIKREEVMYGYAVIGLSRMRLEEELAQNRTTSMAVSLTVLILGTGVAWILSNLLAGPIVAMQEVAAQLAEGKTDVTVAVGVGGELGDLARGFRTMQGNLRLLATQAQSIAQGDLSHSVEARGDLAAAFNQMIANLSELVRQVRDSGTRIGSFATQLSAAIRAQTSNAAQQSAAITQTTATMEELARTSSEITDSSEVVVDIAAQTQENAQSGVDAVKNTLAHMETIGQANQASIQRIVSLSEKVEQINEVMDIINDIADRTKLIAFNAAIEAAGAGEAGRRFGVVAQEIRRLADTVVEATEDIRNRIAEIQEATNNMVIASENNMKSIAQGLQSMQETTGSLEKILASARRTTEAAKQIALSTQQQKTASDQVAQSLQEVADGARHFVHTVEETNKVAGELSDLSKKSMELIGRFKLDGGAAG